MFGILAVAVLVIVALIILGLVVHLLFSPWLWVAGIAIAAWFAFRPRRRSRV
jgi:hypothetical protein